MKKEIETLSTNINGKYFVSTAYRKSSMVGYDMWYYETIVWTFKENQLDKMIKQENAGRNFKTANKYHNRLFKIFTYLEQRSLRNKREVIK